MKKVFFILIWILIFYKVPLLLRSNADIAHQNQTLTVFTWPNVFLPEVIEEFEKETGIKVILNYYNSNEELIVKMNKTDGKGFDLIVPSDYAVALLKENNHLLQLDKSKLNFLDDLNPILLNHDFDPKNDYSIPLIFEVFGFGINNSFPGKLPLTWDALFNLEQINYKVAMTNDPVEATTFGAYYLFKHDKPLNTFGTKQLEKLLKDQKKIVEAYGALRADYFLARNNCELCVSSSDFVFMTQKTFPDIQFVVPEDRTFITIENIAIPKKSTKADLSYQLINFVLKKENAAKSCSEYLEFPSLKGVTNLLETSENYRRILKELENSTSNDVYFIDNVVSESTARQMWVKIKS